MSPTARPRVTLLTQDDCALCDHAKTVLSRIASERPLDVNEVRLGSDEGMELAQRHAILFAPGVLLDGEPFGHGRLSERKLRRALARS